MKNFHEIKNQHRPKYRRKLIFTSQKQRDTFEMFCKIATSDAFTLEQAYKDFAHIKPRRNNDQ